MGIVTHAKSRQSADFISSLKIGAKQQHESAGFIASVIAASETIGKTRLVGNPISFDRWMKEKIEERT